MGDPGKRLREARIGAGFSSASKAANALGMGVSTYSAHENGQNAFGPSEAKRYASTFNVSESWLLFGESEGDIAAPPRSTGVTEFRDLGNGNAWLTINRAVPFDVALKVMQLLGSRS